MNHYFTKNNNLKSQQKDIYFKIRNNLFHFVTDNGVFSISGLDFGSRLLIDSILNINASKVLDLGCGYGPIGIVYKWYHQKSVVTLSDINDRAVVLAKKNAKINQQNVKVINSDSYTEIDFLFNLVITNPPIRTGKKKIYKMFQETYDHLEESGQLIFVMNKKQGAISAIKFCKTIYNEVKVINRKSGFNIIQCIK